MHITEVIVHINGNVVNHHRILYYWTMDSLSTNK